MKLTGRQWRQLIAFVVLVSLGSMFQNCGVSRPSVENMQFASIGFAHTGAETSCASCHEGIRPVSSQNFLAFNPNTTFDSAKHGSGTDCITCHDSGGMPASRISSNWAQGFFDHPVSQTDCATCHTVTSPLANGKTHPTLAAGVQCTSCHSAALNNMLGQAQANYSSLNQSLWGSGGSGGLAYNPADLTNITVRTPNYNATTKILASWTKSAQGLRKYMNHDSAMVPAAMKTDCNVCHMADPVNHVGGVFHATLTVAQQPTSCNDCHGYAVPGGNAAPSPVAPTSVAFLGGDSVNMPTQKSGFDHAQLVGKADCTSCHAQANWTSKTWANGIFHKTTNAASIATCTECHAPTRKDSVTYLDSSVTPAVTRTFQHSLSGQGECVGCHAPSKTLLGAKSGATLVLSDWSGGLTTPIGPQGGSYKLTPTATNLNMTGTTVTGRTPNTLQSIGLLIDHDKIPLTGAPAKTSCTACHSAAGYSGAKFHDNLTIQPTTGCVNCHTNAKMPGSILGWNSLKPMDHGHAAVSAKDCSSCHTAPMVTAGIAAKVDFKDGKFHANLTAAPTSCRECHTPKIIDQPVQPTTTGQSHATFMDRDCLSCHSATGTGGTIQAPTWVGAVGGAPATVTLKPPTGTKLSVTSIVVQHPTMQPGMVCATCHSSYNTTNSIVGFDHNYAWMTAAGAATTVSCYFCHISSGFVIDSAKLTNNNTRTFVNGKIVQRGANHNGANGQSSCLDCHTASSLPAWNSGTNTWTTGGSWNGG